MNHCLSRHHRHGSVADRHYPREWGNEGNEGEEWIIDLLPNIDLLPLRNCLSLASMLALIFGYFNDRI